MTSTPWLRKFLNLYWLRPENAMWRAANCQVLSEWTFAEPSIDVSCGDGLFSFVLAGGELDAAFDIFHSTDNLNEFFEEVDIYDATSDTYSPPIRTRPDRTFTVGTDWKENLLDKAEALDFYGELVQHDNNEPLPFETGRFKTAFSNSAYWVDNLDLHLSELARITDETGRIHLQVKLSHVREWLQTLWNRYEEILGDEVIEMIDRGRSSHYAHLHTDEGWRDRFERNGLDVVSATPTASQLHARMWDIGLRPISPYLIRMANGLPPEERSAVKADWCDTFEKLLAPFVDPTIDYRDRPPAEMVYTLEPVE